MSSEPGCMALDLANDLAGLLAQALRENRTRFGADTLRAFDLGCFPWHGYLELSFLTTDEPGLRNDRSPFTSVADWRFYDFVPGWPAARHIAAAMQREWLASKDRKATADACFRECAQALRSETVGAALALYSRAPDFVLLVVNSDDPNSVNYCTVA
ncbi:hypothetical protein J2X20_002167 [Pelomonas saccharophila]|uniref:Uncharacterized protein n=1 Tax=Roseateles saccharophilus TaxID=304 RepID=A0ABU1YKZ6_ROSSA|nr:hypothetical protein [Roseateles saccharophilus]MDR7269538.1 hypothetical protein [Roseateles saccharophilus]